MKIIPGAALVSLCVVLAALTGSAVYARTPTPTPTATSTPRPPATATPSPHQVALFYGTAWFNGRLATSPVVAKIGDVVCGENVPIVTPTDSNVYLYGLRVLSDQYRA
ncbi:MAG: hypothetical protein IMZ46_13985, partial [Acidobacteria bacterium]|nr:hypothetical protein [Acidobacteriota bacterium]